MLIYAAGRKARKVPRPPDLTIDQRAPWAFPSSPPRRLDLLGPPVCPCFLGFLVFPDFLDFGTQRLPG